MRDKIPDNYVRMEQKLCPVCTKRFDCGGILLHRQLKEIPEDRTVTGWQPCPECQKLMDDGFIALIECDPSKSDIRDAKIKPENAWRTTRIAWIKQEAAKRVFNLELSKMAFIEPAVYEMLVEMMPKEP